MMARVLVRLLLLTLLFTFSSALIMLFGRFCRRQCGGLLRLLWMMVLVLALLPLSLDVMLANRDAWQKAEVPSSETAAPDSLETETRSDGAQLYRKTGADGGKAPMDAELVRVEKFLRGEQSGILSMVAVALVLVWAVGGILLGVRRVVSGVRLRRRLGAVLRVSEEETRKWEALFRQCRVQAGGMAKRARLVISKETIPCAPCMVGIFRPTVYVCARQLTDGTTARCIFAHELQHARHLDGALRMLGALVQYVHWFNPIAYPALACVVRDTELACDSETVRMLGADGLVPYMETLLSVAAGDSAHSRGDAVLCMRETNSKNMMKRRYRNMTGKKLGFFGKAMAGCMALLMVLACVGCAVVTGIGKEQETLHLLTPLTEDIVRSYYGLHADEAITQEMLDGITSLTVVRNTLLERVYAGEAAAELADMDKSMVEALIGSPSVPDLATICGRVYLNCYVNTDSMDANEYGYHLAQYIGEGDVPEVMRAPYFEGVVFDKVKVALGENCFWTNRFRAYYLLMDATALGENDKARGAMYDAHPITRRFVVYLFDPTSSELEHAVVMLVLARAGALDAYTLENDVVDLSVFEVFPNLGEVKLVGLTGK